MAVGTRRRCANCDAGVRARDRFCPSCGTPLDTTATAPRAVATDSASLQVSDTELAGLGEQRKVVTILFADLSGSTTLGERLDPEELRGILASYFNELARQIRRYEGTIDKYIGDAVMAVFGAPVSHEDDAERAINAALAMQQSIGGLNDDLARRHGVRLALRIGINTGEVVAGLLAGDVQRAYTVVGDAVNTAQRFEAAAPLGEVLVSADTRRLAIHSFEFEQTAPLTLKGKAERVVGYRVLRRRYEEIAPEATQFIGRARELDQLRAAIGAAVLGKGQVVNLVGEAGVGKSRLIGELRANLVSGIDRMTVRCASFETNTPYALIADFVRGAFSIHAADDEATARKAIVDGFTALGQPLDEANVTLLLDMLGYATRSSLEPEVKGRVLVDMLRALLRLAAARAPIVLTAEDLHWVDGASLRVLKDLVATVRSLPVLFITTTRPGWTPPWRSETIAMAPLDGQEARDLIEAVFEVPVDSELAEAIMTRTAGNPYFIEEVVRGLKASSLIVERTGRVALIAGATAPVPATIQEVIEARIDRLDPAAQRTLNAGAVCGRTFWLHVLERLLPDLTLQPHLVTLERESFIDLRTVVPEVTYGFRQILIQEVAYETQLHAERRRLHGAVGKAVEALYADRLEEFVDFLAYHYKRSNDEPKAISYLLRAGTRALRLYASEEALRAFTQVLELRPSASDRAIALEGIGDARTPLGALLEARTVYEEALALTEDDPVRQARIERKIGGTYIRAGDYPHAQEWLRRAVTSIGLRADSERAAIWLDITQVAWRQGNYDEAIAAAREGIAQASAARAPQYVADGQKHLGTAYVLKGERADGVRHYRDALVIYEELGDLPGLMNVRNNIGIVYRRESDWAEALREQNEALTIARRLGDGWGIGMVLANIAETQRSKGDFESALATNKEALAVWTQASYAVGVATVHMNIGILHAECADYDAARAALQASLAEWEQLDSRLFLPELYRTFAKVEVESDPNVALSWARRSLDVAREIKARDEEGLALQTLGAVLGRLGRPLEAAAELRSSVEILRTTNNRLDLARSLTLLAEQSRSLSIAGAEIMAFAREAAAIFAEAGADPKDRARAEALLPS